MQLFLETNESGSGTQYENESLAQCLKQRAYEIESGKLSIDSHTLANILREISDKINDKNELTKAHDENTRLESELARCEERIEEIQDENERETEKEIERASHENYRDGFNDALAAVSVKFGIDTDEMRKG